VLLRRGYRYRLYPTPAQAERLGAWGDALRWLWNLAHAQRLYGLRASVPKYYTAFDQINQLTEGEQAPASRRQAQAGVCGRVSRACLGLRCSA
jgi:hypothetical protein